MKTYSLTIVGIAVLSMAASSAQPQSIDCSAVLSESYVTGDSCLVGGWTIANYPKEFLATNFVTILKQEALAGGGMVTDIEMPPPQLTLFPDGTFTFDNPHSIAGFAPVDAGIEAEMKMSFTVNQDLGRWATHGNQLLLCVNRNSAVGTMTFSIPGAGTHSLPINSSELADARDTALSKPAKYSCSGDSARLITQPVPTAQLESLNLSLQRFAGAADIVE